jgi:hypothetical protein
MREPMYDKPNRAKIIRIILFNRKSSNVPGSFNILLLLQNSVSLLQKFVVTASGNEVLYTLI